MTHLLVKGFYEFKGSGRLVPPWRQRQARERHAVEVEIGAVAGIVGQRHAPAPAQRRHLLGGACRLLGRVLGAAAGGLEVKQVAERGPDDAEPTSPQLKAKI